jgi:DNA-binding CsgD family transcriptional regulator
MIKLSPRQAEIFELLSQGHTYKEIGWKLHIGERTVKEHTYKAVAKFQAITVIQAVVSWKTCTNDASLKSENSAS